MAIIKTKPFLMIGILNKRKYILEKLQSLNCIQIEEIENLKKLKLEEPIRYMKKVMGNCEKALKIMAKFEDKKTILNSKKKQIPILKVDSYVKNLDKINSKIKEIIALEKENINLKFKIKEIEKKINYLKEYINLDIPIKDFETKNTKSFIGSLPKNITRKELICKLKNLEKEIYIKIYDDSEFTMKIFIVATKKASPKIKETLSLLDFSAISLKSEKPPKDEIYYYNIKLKNINSNIFDIENKIKSYKKYIYDIKLLIDYLTIRKEKYETIKKLSQTKNTFILKGYLDPKFEKKLRILIEKNFNSSIEIIENFDYSPVFFSNGFFSSPMENITKTYSVPSINDIDPNPIMFFFYYMFFGMMFSDAGYGIFLSVFCFIFSKSKNIDSEKKKNIRLFFLCGISTTFWGLLYGSFFGNIIEKIGTTFLNKNIALHPIWINTTEKPLLLLLFSLNFGVLQLIVGLSIKLYIYIKKRKTKEAVLNILNWIFILFGIMLCLTGITFKTNSEKINSIIFATYSINCGIFSILFGSILTIISSFCKNKGIMKFLGSFIELYKITSYVSDILSYSRLMALGIATGVIANVVNILATMGGKNFFGIIFFVIIFIVGHSINFAINILGAYVHTNRLQYVEFFSKFYEGGGKLFKPFGMHTKYFEFVKTKKDN